MPNTQKSGPSQAANLMLAVAAGSVGWWTFNAYCRRREAYREYYFYGPILEIAAGQGWFVKCECSPEKSAQKKLRRGRPPSIDFVFENGTELVGLEVKWVGTKPTRLNLDSELKKLERLRRLNPKSKVQSFIMIFGLYSLFEGSGPKISFAQPRLNGLLRVKASLENEGSSVTTFNTRRTKWAALVMRVNPSLALKTRKP